MKNFTLFLFACVTTLLFVAGLDAQTNDIQVEKDPRVRIERTAGLINLTKPGSVAEHSNRVQKDGLGPGDTPLFLLHANREFVRPGETIELSLISMVNSSETYYISGMILKPGTSGEYDGSIPPAYFNAETGNWGAQYGVRTGEFIKAHIRMFNPEDNYGKHQITFVTYRLVGNELVLVQQIWVTIYLVNAGEFNERFYIDTVRPSRNGLLSVTGRFPMGIPLYYFVGVPRYTYSISGPDPGSALYATRNGTLVEGISRATYSSSTMEDVAMWSPYTREAIFKPMAWVDRSAR